MSPNPFRDIANFEIQLAKEGEYLIQVFDINGKEMSHQLIELNKGLNKLPFDGSDLTDGLYSYRLSNAQGFISGKMIIVK